MDCVELAGEVAGFVGQITFLIGLVAGGVAALVFDRIWFREGE